MTTTDSSHAPRAATELDRWSLRGELQWLASSRLFWVGLVLKVASGSLFGSHFATRWFAPFFYEFVHGHFNNPWQVFLDRGEPLAFPYGPGMLLVGSISWLPALVTSFDPASHVGLLLLRLPLLAADIGICVLLVHWLRINARDVLLAYWLSPIVFYASYVHGQLDLIPTALLCVSLFLVFARRITLGALVLGFAVATKAHLLLAVPFAVVYLFRLARPRLAWLRFAIICGATALAMYAVLLPSPAFRVMVLGSPEAQRIWSVVLPYSSSGLLLYLAPAALVVGLMRFVSYRKINQELTLMFLGALYLSLVALVPPQPGWFVWSIPFVAYLGARFARTGRFLLVALSSTYLLFFGVGDPVVFLESLDPVMGRGYGAVLAAEAAEAMPAVFGPHGASVTWTLLCVTTAVAAYEMYRRGVRSNAIYHFRDESFMMAIVGDSGAGKRTVGRDLSGLLGSKLSLIDGDDDHKWERGHVMWAGMTHLNPRANRLGVQVGNVDAVRGGGEVLRRHYDHQDGRFTAPLRLKPNDFIAVVGLLPLYLASQRRLFHLKVFIDPDEGLRRERKVTRDAAERGYSRDQVLRQIEDRVDNSNQFVKPQMAHADVIVRHAYQSTTDESVEGVSFELSGAIEPHRLIDALEASSSLTVEWIPASESARDIISLAGRIAADELRVVADLVIPNLDELVEKEGWLPGGRGLIQLVLVYSISARLRAPRADASFEAAL